MSIMELKTMQFIKNEVAINNGYEDWVDLIMSCSSVGKFNLIYKYEDEAIKLYTLQIAEAACKSQRELCASKATWDAPDSAFTDGCYVQQDNISVDKDSILNTPSPNIQELIDVSLNK